MLAVSRTGYELLADPMLNKGIALPGQEPAAQALNSMLPPPGATLDEQVDTGQGHDAGLSR